MLLSMQNDALNEIFTIFVLGNFSAIKKLTFVSGPMVRELILCEEVLELINTNIYIVIELMMTFFS